MKINNKTQQRALDSMFGEQSVAPPQSFHWWFGVALWDALAPLTGEPIMIERWPDWPQPVLAHGETFTLKAFELRFGQ